MSEAMISESIVEAEWILQGYWTRMRYPYQTDKSGWSDIDVLAYNPESKHLVYRSQRSEAQRKIYSPIQNTQRAYTEPFLSMTIITTSPS